MLPSGLSCCNVTCKSAFCICFACRFWWDITLVMQLRSDRNLYDMQENNRSELQRLDSERKQDFLVMLKGFVASQVLFQPISFSLFSCIWPTQVFVLDGWSLVSACSAGLWCCKYSTFLLPLTCANRMHVHKQAAYAEKIVDGWETVAEETSGYARARGSDSLTS